jgi:hypothetical protein
MAENKFNFVLKRDQNSDQKKKLDSIYEQWFHHVVIENFFGLWKEWIAWWEGDQYTFWNKKASKLENVEALIERETKNVYNRIMPMIRQQHGDVRYDHEFIVIANTSEDEDKKAANIGSEALECTNSARHFKAKINTGKFWTLITGNAYWKEWWNKSLLAFALDPKSTKPVKDRGDVDYDFVNPFNIRTDPHAKCREDWRWVIEGKRLPVSVIENRFSLPSGTISGESIDKAEGTGLFERPEFKRDKEPTAILLEHWERPTNDFEKGRFIVTCQEVLLYDDKSPAPNADIPYFHMKGLVPILDEQYGDSMVRVGQASQRRINRYASQNDEMYENFKPKNLIPLGSLRSPDLKAYKRSGIDFIEYNSRYGAPSWQNPPTPPDSSMSWISFQEREFETETSTRETSYGRLPKYASRASGVLFEGLRQQDTAVLFQMIEDWNTVLCDAMKYRLELIQKHYDHPRLIKMVGKENNVSIVYFEGAELRDNTDVRVKSGIDVFRNKDKRQEVVMAGVEKGMIPIEKALNTLDFKGLEEYTEDEFVDERQGLRQIERMKQKPGIYIGANPDDNHEILYKVFNNYRKTEEFETLSPKVQLDILRRINEEKEFLNLGTEPQELGEGEGEETPVPTEEVGAAPAIPTPAPEVAAPEVAAPETAAPGGEVGPEVVRRLMSMMQQGGLQ